MSALAAGRRRPLPQGPTSGIVSNARETTPDLDEVKACIEKRLFVGRIPAAATESEVEELFSEFGTVTECKLVRGGRICFIGYETWAETHRALLAVDGRLSLPSHRGSGPLVVSFAERTRQVGQGGGSHLAKGLTNSRVFVGSLPEHTTDSELRRLFNTFGEVQAANLLPAKGHRRCGFVNFQTWGEALDAIETLDGALYPEDSQDGNTITVVSAEPRASDENTLPAPVAVTGVGNAPLAPPIAAITKKRRIDSPVPTLGGVAANIASAGRAEMEDMRLEFDDLKARYLSTLEGQGTEQECTLIHWSLMKLRAVLYPGPASAANLVVNGRLPPAGAVQKATRVAAINRLTPAGAPMPEGPAIPIMSATPLAPRTGPPPVTDDRDMARLFIGGLPQDCSSEELRALVDQIPFESPVEDCKILECRVLQNRGIGFLRFSSWQAAEECLEELNERRVNGWPTPLRAQWASPKTGGSGDVGGAAEEGGGNLLQGRSGSGGLVRSERAVPSEADDGTLDRHRLFIGQLQRGIDRTTFLRVFEPYGEIEDCKLLEDKGVGYITFTRSSSAREAMEDLHDREVVGVSRREGLNVQFAKRR